MQTEQTKRHYSVEFRIDGDTPGECRATAYIKMSYAIDTASGALVKSEPVALVNDFRDENLQPRLPPHSDFWPRKQYTDVAVIGSAHAPDSNSVTTLPVSVRVGKRHKRITVIGERFIEFEHGKPRISDSAPYTSMPLGIDKAYGGADFRVPYDVNDAEQTAAVLSQMCHPGLYPRNPWGTGYLVEREPIDGMPLPTQEDPDDRLTNARLVSGDPALWYEQPLPAHIGWLPVNCFPRSLFLAIEGEPWFPPPDDGRLAEVKKGHLATGYRALLADHTFGTEPHWRFYQEADPELMFRNNIHGAPVELCGLHPGFDRLQFTLPEKSPDIKMKFENTLETIEPILTSVEIHPDKQQVYMTYAVTMIAPRLFIPGIHKNIPLAVSVNGDKAVRFDTPKTIKSSLADAEARRDAQAQKKEST